LAFVGVAVANSPYPPLSCEDQVAISNLFLEVLDTFNYGKDSTPGDLAAKWVRLQFHDSVTWDPVSRTGGAHACIAVSCSAPNECERTLQANNGLAPVADYLDQLWSSNGWSNVISRPDFWSLAAKVAVEWASGGATVVPWGYGRTECTGTCPLWANRHPDASQGFYAMQNHMVNRLGLSWTESIALLGAHSLGETHIENSGYHGRWVPYPANYLNNNFYKVLLTYDWYSTTVPPYQGSSSSYNSGYGSNSYAQAKVEYVTDELRGTVMLPSDGAIYYKNQNFNCTLSHNSKCPLFTYHCPYASNLQGIVRQFASDNAYWLSVYTEAFKKAQEWGGDTIYYNPPTDVEYDLYQTHWTGYTGWYTNPNDYGILYSN